MKKIYLIIGIPGAGKSYWLQNKIVEKNCVLDDISQLKNPLDLLTNAINDSNIKNIYISDVNFLELSTLKKAQEMIRQDMKGQLYHISYIIFKSNKEISESNVKLRNDGRNVRATIQRFYKNYDNIIDYLRNEDIEIIEAKAYQKTTKKLK